MATHALAVVEVHVRGAVDEDQFLRRPREAPGCATATRLAAGDDQERLGQEGLDAVEPLNAPGS